MIYQCDNKACQCVWAPFPTPRKAVHPPYKTCPDCARR